MSSKCQSGHYLSMSLLKTDWHDCFLSMDTCWEAMNTIFDWQFDEIF